MFKKFFVVIVVYNSWLCIGKCLDNRDPPFPTQSPPNPPSSTPPPIFENDWFFFSKIKSEKQINSQGSFRYRFKWSLNAKYETLWHVNLRAIMLRWPSRPLGINFCIKVAYSKIEILCTPCTGMHQTHDPAQFCMTGEIICLSLLQRWTEMATSVAVDTAWCFYPSSWWSYSFHFHSA